MKARLLSRVRLAALAVVVVAASAILGGPALTAAILLAALGAGLWALLSGPSIILLNLQARIADPVSWPGLVRILALVASRAEIIPPTLLLSPDVAPWACSLSDLRSGPAVIVSQGLVTRLEPEELEAVLAHELAHVRSGDLAWMTFLAVLAGAPEFLAGRIGGARRRARGKRTSRSGVHVMPPQLILAGAAVPALLLQLALDRQIDLEADRLAARFCGNPMALASALAHLEEAIAASPGRRIPGGWMHLFTVDPAPGPHGPDRDLFRIWASTSERIGRLEELAGIAP